MPETLGPGDDLSLVPWDRLSGAELMRAVTPLFERWAVASTDATSPNVHHLLQSKVRTLLTFFEFVGKPPGFVSPDDVLAWQRELDGRGHTPTTVYLMISRVSSFYDWAMQHPPIARLMPGNPVAQVRPRPPAPYRNARPLSDDALGHLLEYVRDKISEGSLVARRDYALLLFYLLTGMSREEIIRLRWGDLAFNDDGSVVFSTLVRGSRRRVRQINDPILQEALLSYLMASGRLEEMQPDSPLWARHDPGTRQRGARDAGAAPAKHAGDPDGPLTSKAFEKNIKSYAAAAGLGKIHIQQLRHTYARLVGEEIPSLEDARRALGLADPVQARRYLSRVTAERDLMSRRIAARLGLSGQQAELEDEDEPSRR